MSPDDTGPRPMSSRWEALEQLPEGRRQRATGGPLHDETLVAEPMGFVVCVAMPDRIRLLMARPAATVDQLRAADHPDLLGYYRSVADGDGWRLEWVDRSAL